VSRFLWWALALAAALAVAVAPFASPDPDGLERVAEDLGFAERAAVWLRTPFADYLFPGIGSERVATAVAGALGVAATAFAVMAVGRLLTRRMEPGPGRHAR